MRTVEMESWSESRLGFHDETGHANEILDETPISSPGYGDMKHGGVFITSKASGHSSSSIRDIESPRGERYSYI